MHQHTITSVLTVLLASAPTAWAGMYTKNSPVLQVDAKSFDRLVNKSNYTSIVEFYAPWCGHCQNLKPAYEKAAKNLHGLAKVAAVDCDDDANKPLCSSMGIKGFPTLKIVRPGKKPGRPVVEDYNGGRTAGAITEALVQKMNNHVTRATDKDLDAFLAKGDNTPKAILFSDKGTTSALLRGVAIDFLGVIDVAQIRNKESAAVAKFAIQKFPTLVLVPGQGQEPIVYGGEMAKDAIVQFLSQAGEPNPDPAPAKAKGDKKQDKPKAEKAKKQGKHKVEEPVEEAEREASSEAPPAASTPDVIAIPTASNKADVAEKCLQPKSRSCILALVPGSETEESSKAINALSHLNTKYIHGQRQPFHFIAVPDTVDELSFLRNKLEANKDIELVALNAHRKWWRRYDGDFDAASVEAWVDMIRMGEGVKTKLPGGMVQVEEEPEEPTQEETKAGEPATEEPTVEEPEVEEPEVEEPVVEEPVVEETEVEEPEVEEKSKTEQAPEAEEAPDAEDTKTEEEPEAHDEL